jgi:hypothetical protein
VKAAKEAADTIARMVRPFDVEDRRTILQLLCLATAELNVTAHLQALISAADYLAPLTGTARIAIVALVLQQFGITEASYSCAECGTVFTEATLCSRCAAVKQTLAADAAAAGLNDEGEKKDGGA